jgi:geranylgeranyl diphosphate synthase type I
VADPHFIAYGYHGIDGGQRAMQRILSAGVAFTAVLASNDESAIGAMAATEDQEVINHFKAFGHKIGIGFQIQVDLLGIWGDPAMTGKSARNDIRNKKKTLPVLYALQYSKQKDELRQLYAKEQFTDADIDRVFKILTEAGAYDYTVKTAHRYRDEALAELQGLCPGSKAMEDLVAIGRFLVDRDY